MATYPSDVAGATVPAKSGVRDTIRVPFVCAPGTALANNDVCQLAKVSAGHRVVGYYVETNTLVAIDSTIKLQLGLPTPIDVLTSSQLARVNGSVASQYGSRNSAGAVVTGTYAVSAIPSAVYEKDGTFDLVVTAAGTSPAVGAKFTGYIEVQPA